MNVVAIIKKKELCSFFNKSILEGFFNQIDIYWFWMGMVHMLC
jgi:hypothetical protein